jgi:pilus assembly protein FimV
MSQKQRLTLALALALGSSQALALGLGNIEIRSGLNEPLVAHIPVVSATPAELENLRVRLASPESFARVGAVRPAIMAANLEFSIGRDEEGRAVIRVTTPDRVRDPYLNFLIEVEWQRGRLLREYTVLLDPPVTSTRRVAPARAPVATPEPPVRAPTPAPAEPVAPPTPPPAAPPVATPTPVERPTPPPPAETAPPPRPTAPADGSFGPIRDGQTLWSVAQQVRPQGVDTNQAMIALLAANPEAFIGGNINRLRSGAVLRIPTADEFAVFSAADAAFQVRQQAEDWQATVRQPVSAAGVERPATPARTPRESRLELVPPGADVPATATQAGVAADARGRELRADLDRAREQVTTLQQENRELQSRVSDLERLDSDARALVQLKDSQLAEAQRRLAQLEAERDAAREAARLAGTAPAPVGDPAPAPGIDEPPPLDLDPADDPDRLAEVAPPAEPVDAVAEERVIAPPPPVREPRPAAQPVAPAPAPAPTPTPTPRPWYMNPLVIGGAVLALIGLLVVAMRRRRQPEEPRRTGVAEAYAAAAAAAAAKSAGASKASPASDQAEQQLLDAVAEQPDDLGRHLALVRHYYDIGDASGFEGAAEAMYAQLYDPEDMAWKQVVAMGRELLPDHPLFAVTEPDQAEFGALDTAGADSGEPDGYGFGEEAAAGQPAGRSEVEWGAPAPSPGDTRRYSVDELDRIAREQNDVAEQVAAEQQADEGYDLDLEGGDTGGAPGSDFADADAELDSVSVGGDDAAATKLELARAYLDMGDVEGARGMLEEVVGEGNAGQRSEAKRLLDEIR